MSRRPFRLMTNRLQRCVDDCPSGDGEDGDGVRPLPGLMFMLLMVIMVVQMGVLHRSMAMLERHRVP